MVKRRGPPAIENITALLFTVLITKEIGGGDLKNNDLIPHINVIAGRISPFFVFFYKTS